MSLVARRRAAEREAPVAPVSVSGSLDAAEIRLEGGHLVGHFAGWALVGGAPAIAVLVQRSGRTVGALPVGRPRPDVAEALSDRAAAAAGYAGVIDVSFLDDESDDAPVRFELVALGAAGAGGALATWEAIVERDPLRAFGVRGTIDEEGIPEVFVGPALSISGWAAIGGRPAAGVVALVDGAVVGTAPTGVARADVPDELAAGGFELAINLVAALPLPEEVTVVIEASDAEGRRAGELARVTRSYLGPRRLGVPLGQIDHWSEGTVVERGLLRVYGWAALPEGSLAGVALQVNGRIAAMARADDPRPEVARYLGEGCRHAGFDARVDLGEIDDEDVLLECVAVVDPRSPVTFGPDVAVVSSVRLRLSKAAGAKEVSGAIDALAPGEVRRAIVNLWGWALGRRQRIDRVEILVEGVSVGEARIGLDRLDLADRFDDPAAATSGYEHLVDFGAFPDSVRRVEVAAVAHFCGGGSAELASRTVRLLPRPRPPKARDEARARELKARTRARLESLPRRSSERLHLACFTHQLGYGGAQLWLSELLFSSRAGRAYDATVVSPMDGALRRDLEHSGIEVHVTSGFPMASAEQFEGSVEELALLGRTAGWNAVLVNTALCSIGAAVAQALELPCVWAIHESWPPDEFFAMAYPPDGVDPIVRRDVTALFGEVDALVFEAEATRTQYLGHVDPARAHVVHYGVDLRAIDRYLARVSRESARADLGIGEDEVVVLVVGTLEPRKAQSTIARAFGAICERHPRARLLLVGAQKTPYARAVRRFVEDAGLEDRITIEPIVQDTYLRYRAADLFLSASDVESLPRSVLEVMYFGVPVLATNVFGLPELITHGVDGLLFEAKSLEAVQRVLDEALEMPPEVLVEIGAKGRERIGRSYDARGYARTIVEMVEQLRVARNDGG